MFFGVLTIFTSSFIVHGVRFEVLKKKKNLVSQRMDFRGNDGLQRSDSSGHHHIAVFAINILLQVLVRGDAILPSACILVMISPFVV